MDHSPLSEEQLTQLIDQRLRDLPQPRAPRSLATNVMAAIATHNALPWWRRPWVFWPRHFQVIFICGALASASFILWYFGGVDLAESIGKERDTLFSHLGFLRPLLLIGSAIWEFGFKLARSVSPTAWMIMAGVVAAAYASCLSLGTLCYRLAVRQPNQ